MDRKTTALPSRVLGQGFSVSAIGYGAMGLSEFYGPSDDTQSLAMLDEVADAGVTLIDTADMYGRGHNETLIGRFLVARGSAMDSIQIATKCGIDRPEEAEYARGINNRPEYIRACCDASLKRLDVERIDLYYIHRVDPQADITETMGALKGLVEEGKIAHVGLCEVSAATLEKAHAVHPITALQTEYSLWTRDIEQSILPKARELGIGLVAYSPLGRGFLTGRIASAQDLAEGDFRRNNPRFQQDNLTHNLQLLGSVKKIAERHAATPGQVALAWLLAQGDNIVPIPGTRRSRYLQENLAAAALELSVEDKRELEKVFTQESVQGERYGEEGMKGVNA
ncbi:aldo/keto reductase [Halomonas sp. M20]|uniref:aldo/keto reductase n=1 Tax=Halomonas sp. M20 TaxID=2763264 RepID=UPI001D0BBF8B|nr:aldo/keto reductase [Halomonas sp. M20]